MDTESSAEARVKEAREQLAATQAEFFLYLQKFFRETPQEAQKSFFEALLKKGDLSKNPLCTLFKVTRDFHGDEIDVEKTLWGDLAEIVLNKINGIEKERAEYVPLIQIIEEDFHFSESTFDWEIQRVKNHHEFVRSVLHSLEDYFSSAIFFPCKLVYQGMPLFECYESGEFVKTPVGNMDANYIFMKGHYADSSPSGSYPEWAKKYYFKNEHLLAHKHFFDGFEGSDEALQVRREAFRAHIGMIEHQGTTEDVFPSEFLQSKLMKLLLKVLERYYGDLYDENNRNSWPTQSMIIEWLMKEFGLSKREAESIDIVSRPDIARGK